MVKASHLFISQKPPLAVPERKPAAHVLGADVSSVLYDDVLLDAADQAPELLLYQLCRNHLRARGRRHEILFLNTKRPVITFRLLYESVLLT